MERLGPSRIPSILDLVPPDQYASVDRDTREAQVAAFTNRQLRITANRMNATIPVAARAKVIEEVLTSGKRVHHDDMNSLLRRKRTKVTDSDNSAGGNPFRQIPKQNANQATMMGNNSADGRRFSLDIERLKSVKRAVAHVARYRPRGSASKLVEMAEPAHKSKRLQSWQQAALLLRDKAISAASITHKFGAAKIDGSGYGRSIGLGVGSKGATSETGINDTALRGADGQALNSTSGMPTISPPVSELVSLSIE